MLPAQFVRGRVVTSRLPVVGQLRRAGGSPHPPVDPPVPTATLPAGDRGSRVSPRPPEIRPEPARFLMDERDNRLVPDDCLGRLIIESVKRNALRVAAATVASGVLAAGAVALAGAAGASTLSP